MTMEAPQEITQNHERHGIYSAEAIDIIRKLTTKLNSQTKQEENSQRTKKNKQRQQTMEQRINEETTNHGTTN